MSSATLKLNGVQIAGPSDFSQQVAGGFTIRLGPGYQFRFELRDVVVPLKRVIAPSDDFLQPPTNTKIFHHVALTFGLDVILERGRSRRY